MTLPCIILAGGKGTRLQSVVSDMPKCMAPIKDHPFLHWQIKLMQKYGFRKFILSLGYMADNVAKYLEQTKYPGLDIQKFVESKPLGTGGAIKKIMNEFNLKEAFVVNGDTLLFVDNLNINLSLNFKKKEILKVHVFPNKNNDRYGSVTLDNNGNVLSFKEKDKTLKNKSSFTNSGFYWVSKDCFKFAEHKELLSFEDDILNQICEKYKVNSSILIGEFIDIGIPADYKRACNFDLEKFL